MINTSISEIVHSIEFVGLNETVESYGLEEHRALLSQMQEEHRHLDALEQAVRDCWKRINGIETLLTVRGVCR
jgi:hypothetical protein